MEYKVFQTMGRFSAEIDDESDDEGEVLHEASMIRRRGPQERSSSQQPMTENISFHQQEQNNDSRIYNDLIYRDENHMMYHHPQFIERQQPPRRSFFWNFCLVIFLIIMQHYLPPPPPPNNSWHEYVSSSTQGVISTIQNMAKLSFYIASGTLGNIYADGAFWIDTIISGEHVIEQQADHLCRLMVPIADLDMNANSILMNYFQGNIVGHKFALENISQTLSSWNPFPQSSMEDSVTKLNKPLTMLFTGSDGVGKHETSKQVANALLNGCQNSILKEHTSDCEDRYPSCLNDNSSGILEIRGVDFALENDATMDDATSGSSSGSGKEMVQVILNHIHSRGNAGAVIILKHVEDLSSDATMALVRLLGKSSVSFTKPSSTKLKVSLFASLQQQEAEIVDLQLGNCVFIVTTDIGANKIFEGIRSLMSSPSKAIYDGVQSDIVRDVEKHFGQNVSRILELFLSPHLEFLVDPFTQISISISIPYVQIFDAIVPFWPLQYADLEQILKRKLSHENMDGIMNEAQIQHSHERIKFHTMIQVEDTLIKFMVSPKVIEYIEMRTGRNDESFIFAKNGGHDLTPGSILRKAVDKILLEDSFHSKDEVIVLDYAGRDHEIILKICGANESCIHRSTLNLHEIINTFQ